MNRQSLRTTFCLLLLTLVLMRTANGFVGLFYAEAKVKTESEIIAGLDEPTRKLIAGMPETFRKETVELLRQTLPLIEKSMTDFLKEVDTRVERRINQLVCSGQAAGQGIAEELKGVVVGERPTPVRELVDRYDGRSTKFDGRSARSIAIDYEDFLQQAGITACRLVADAGTQRVDDVRVQARERWRTWTEIESQCANPADCLVKRHVAVRELVVKADSRDVERAEAKRELAEVKLIEPERGLWARTTALFGFERWAASKADWLAYEAQLVKLRAIERKVSTAKGARTTLARRYLSDAKAAVLEAERVIETAKARLSDSVPTANEAAKKDAAAAGAPRTELIAQLDQAVMGDADLKDEAELCRKKLRDLEATAASIARLADTKNQAIAAVAAEAARRAKERQEAIEAARAERWDRRAPR
jgi:hypothetical protein